jgi:tetratricopeptide (TPR) repeat protein
LKYKCSTILRQIERGRLCLARLFGVQIGGGMTEYPLREHLVKRQVDPRWLKRTAIELFADASNSGRLVAFLGSFASKHFGYPEWSAMWGKFYSALGGSHSGLLGQLHSATTDDAIKYDQTTLADLGELASGKDRDSQFEKFLKARAKFLNDTFRLKLTGDEHAMCVSLADALAHRLGVKRLMTLNYDVELEWALMTLNDERQTLGSRERKWHDLALKGIIHQDDMRLLRKIPGRGEIVSDVASTTRSDILVEFALRQPAFDRHIVHLHGRYDQPLSTLVTRRDYRDRYWQDGPERLPYNCANELMLLASPVVFVGLGASEADVMRTLEQYFSDNPNRRRIPTFLLWNIDPDVDNKNLRRIWFYRQYGIHLLYADELTELAEESPALTVDDKPEVQMEAALRALASIAERKRLPAIDKTRFRNPQLKFAPADKKRVSLWSIEEQHNAEFEFSDDVLKSVQDDRRITLIEGEPGSCKGGCASALARAIEDQYQKRQDISGRVVIINAAFAFETDSLSAILSGAYDGRTAFDAGRCRLDAVLEAREQLYQAVSGQSDSHNRRLTLIINGADRLIAHDGTALSSEIDWLVRVVLDLTTGRSEQSQKILNAFDDVEELRRRGLVDTTFPIKMILIGTQRVRRYLDCISSPQSYQLGHLAANGRGEPELRFGQNDPNILENACTYFARVAEAFEQADAEIRWSAGDVADRTNRRKYFYAQLLDPDHLSRAGAPDSILALEIMRCLAFIGQPAESAVLAHLHTISSLLPRTKRKQLLDETLAWLINKKLVIKVGGFVDRSSHRLGLHKTLVTEFRERHGVPLTDSRLSAGFNLSLYAAQPSDNYVPDLAWHDDLGTMVDWLLGAYRDDPFETRVSNRLRSLKWVDFERDYRDISFYDTGQEHHIRLGSAETANCLRAAVSLLRGYYSVPALLMQDNRALDVIMRDGPLTEHGERLRRVMRLHRDISAVRGFLQCNLSAQEFGNYCGPEPLYSDDLLWVQNEYGVVMCAQGELYQARHAFRQAERTNLEVVEFRERGPNWLRLQMNQVQVDVERGKIVPAEERLRNIELAINEIGRLISVDEKHEPFDHILATYKDYPYQHERDFLRRQYPEELTLLVALAVGYLGWCLHLRGALATAEEHLVCSIKMLQDLGEMRAYSFFQRHLAAVYHALGNEEQVRLTLDLCVSAAGPGRQPDIDHSGRIAKIQYSSDRQGQKMPLTIPVQRIPQLMESYRYAQASDMYRLQVETAAILAGVHLDNGDTDSALRYVHKAMAIAARYGFALRKITLRIMLGRIMTARGDVELARRYFVSAANLGTRIRYERAVEAAENGLVDCKGG